MDNEIITIRKMEGWTQDEMASKFGVSREAINKMESGKMPISAKTLIKIQEYKKEKNTSHSVTLVEELNAEYFTSLKINPTYVQRFTSLH